MDFEIKRILRFLAAVAANNNRPWFEAHRAEYDACRADFEALVTQAIAAIASFDPEVAHLTAKDCCYRFYRDTRFSSDKSPYKRHFGAYICARGKKSLHGGYYIHLQPGACMLAVGSYWLPTNILTAMRNEIMGNIDAWREAVEAGKFISLFGYAGEGEWIDDTPSPRGFGLARLKTVPKGFPRDYEHIDYLKMKDYCAWHAIDDSFFDGDDWQRRMVDVFGAAKPMLDFTNSVIDDYE